MQENINMPMVCSLSLSLFQSTTEQWKSLQTTESEQFAYSLSKRSYHCVAHSYSWGHGQAGALIGPVRAQSPPLWSELTAIGWLFISNHIPVDPVANGYRLFFLIARAVWFRAKKLKVVWNEVLLIWTAKYFSSFISEIISYNIHEVFLVSEAHYFHGAYSF